MPTVSADVGSLLEKQGLTLTGSADSKLQKHVTASSSIDAQVVIHHTLDSSTDSKLQKHITASASVGGFLQYSAIAEFELPVIEVTSTGQVGHAGEAEVDLPAVDVSATGLTGRAVDVDIDLPALQVSATDGNYANVKLPAIDVTAAGFTGRIASVSFKLPKLQVSATGDSPRIASVSFALPSLEVYGTAVLGKNATTSIKLPRLSVASTGLTGNLATATITLPVIEVTATGRKDLIGIAEISLPSLEVSATGYVGTVSATIAYVLNTKTGALTRYTNFPFNSFADIDGTQLAASSSGLFELTGDSDNGTDITFTLTGGKTDFGSPMLKRVADMYIAYITDGDLRLNMATDNDDYDYILTATGMDDLHPNRVKLGRGVVGRYWQPTITNMDGCDAEINALDFGQQELTRKVH